MVKNTKKMEAETEACRSQLSLRFAGVQASLVRRGVSPAFVRAAKADPMGDMGFMGGLIFNAIVAGPLAGFVSAHAPAAAHHGLTDHFNCTVMTGALEGVSALQDIAGSRAACAERPSIFYPQGRRKAAIKSKLAQGRFNRAANENGRFSVDVQMDLAEMFRIADMLACLETQNDAEPAVSENTPSVAAQTSKKLRPRALRIAA
ncbi:MAG: hypothetical protein KGL10_03535 [Alphaproteobacteria bacterium]|nr:hypothetical protein [Alphaproteobacteria bacterium]